MTKNRLLKFLNAINGYPQTDPLGNRTRYVIPAAGVQDMGINNLTIGCLTGFIPHLMRDGRDEDLIFFLA